MGCMYAVTWNNKNYKDYSTAYKDIMYDAAKNLENPDAWSKSWQDLIPWLLRMRLIIQISRIN